MQRNLKVDVDGSTWQSGGGAPSFPSTFTSGLSTYVMNITEMLMMIGYLTTPISSTGVSLSEFWAWIRYLAAIANQADLSLTQSFSELDSHQKTILSDDFGVGVPMLWLADKLSLMQIVDGRYFVQRIAVSIGATQARTAKRGPDKTPDFVAQDMSGKWHVIECKGTQSGSGYSQKQLGIHGPPAEGGVAQKLSIRFPPGHTGQRLVCGLSIDVEGGNGSVLRIIDPPLNEPFVLDSAEIKFAQDAANRGVLARALRMAGLEATAELVAALIAPSSQYGDAGPLVAKAAGRTEVEERDARSRSEIDSALSRLVLGDDFCGRKVVVELPREVVVNGRSVRKVAIRQGVHRDVLSELMQQPSVPTLADVDSATRWVRRIGRTEVSSSGHTATMRIGSLFRMELDLVT